ncbi:MAG: maltotransferase domain-containing protein [Verrucomicrobiales bacterium]
MKRPNSLVIQHISPWQDLENHAVKRIPGQPLSVSADIFKDGHDLLSAALRWRRRGSERTWESPMLQGESERWSGYMACQDVGKYEVSVVAWPDEFSSWRYEMRRKLAAGLNDLSTEHEAGRLLIKKTAANCSDAIERPFLESTAETWAKAARGSWENFLKNGRLGGAMRRWSLRPLQCATPWFPLHIDDPHFATAAWYEFFPRSAEGLADRGSKFRDVMERVEDAERMGFDVIYFPPIHPIGVTKRKGRNNSLTCEPGEPGVPYAIGSKEGGHKSVAPELGTLEDFDWLIGQLKDRGMELALDFAINCSPDHPYVSQHPEWFFHRPDGSIKYAENPPKKYEDVYPLNFHNEHWEQLWKEMVEIILFWRKRGVRMFRVDNPHTKPVAFWEYLISEVQERYPDTCFLSEAFTHPKMMQTLAKVGFTQSYTYFTWRNSAHELKTYLIELTSGPMRYYFRGNLFTNTPDILPFYLQHGGRPAFMIRAVCAATLSSVYGIYSGFELLENTPVAGKEEYLDSEKYQFKSRNWDLPGNIKDWVGAVNQARLHNPALHGYENLTFLGSSNENILAFAKLTPAGDNIVIVVVNTDPFHPQAGTIELPLHDWNVSEEMPYLVEDFLDSGKTYRWVGRFSYVALGHNTRPAHIFQLRRPRAYV